MTYDMAVWAGSAAADDEPAGDTFARLMEPVERQERAPLTPALRSFVDALLTRWPDITDDAGAGSPWASAPITGDASGDYLYLNLVWSQCEVAAPLIAGMAAAHGLVCYDPQSDAVWPAGPEDGPAPDVGEAAAWASAAMAELGDRAAPPPPAPPPPRRRRWFGRS